MVMHRNEAYLQKSMELKKYQQNVTKFEMTFKFVVLFSQF